MYNPDRIRLMTQAALFEEKEGKEAFKVNGYFLVDYVTYHMLKGGISATFAYIILAGLWIMSQLEEFLGNLHNMDFASVGRLTVNTYIKYMVVVELLILGVYIFRYFIVRQEVKGYSEQLNRIGQLYAAEGKGGRANDVPEKEPVPERSDIYEEALYDAYQADYQNNRIGGGK